MCELRYRAPTRYHVPSRGETGFVRIALMLAMSAVTTAVAFCAATMRIGVTLSMPSATALAIFVKPICLIFWALQRAEVPLFCFNVRYGVRTKSNTSPSATRAEAPAHSPPPSVRRCDSHGSAGKYGAERALRATASVGSRFVLFFDYYAHLFYYKLCIINYSFYLSHKIYLVFYI